MKQVIMVIHCINLLLAIGEMWIVFKKMRKRAHYCLLMNCFSLIIYSLGSLLMLFVETKEAYYIAFTVSWIGKVGVTVSMLFFCIHLCESKISAVVSIGLSIFSVICLGVILTTKQTGLYYKEIYLVKEEGMTILEYVKGPWHTVWKLTVTLIILICCGMLVKALIEEKNKRKREKYFVVMLALLVEVVIGFMTALPIGRYYDFNQLGFVLCMILVLIDIFRNDLMDTESMAKEYIIDELSAGVIAVDKNETVEYCNKQMLQIFPEIVSDEQGVIAQIKNSINTGEPISIGERLYNFEERQMVYKSLEEFKMYVMIDTTKHYQNLREVEREKQIADAANRAKSEFLARMSHEIRTPINAVLGMDEMILRESNENNIKEYAMDIQTASRTLLNIINDILDLDKIEAGKMEIVPIEYDVSEMIYDISNMIKIKAEDKNLSFRVSVDPDIPTKLFGDDVRIRQILMNLLTNAVKYTHSGEVWINVNLKQIIKGEDGDNAILHVEVGDTGIGIKDEDMDKLFSEFERIEIERNRNIEGTGLGIPITMRLLVLMDSKLNVESEYGKGTVFYFDLSQKITEATPIGDYESKVGATRSKPSSYRETFIAPDARILVVDDNKVNRKVISLLLKKTQIGISEAENGYKAIELATSNYYDVIFMDHMMPGMDGVEAMNRIRDVKDGPCVNTPIIVLTANAVEGSKETYLDVGFDGYLSKPVESGTFFNIIKEVLPKEKIKPISE
ncbi:MAG: response regulator [Lachnospiraceae bacterium]|nr:response regulator [Lachnospiraceae bacterium]